MSDPFAIDCFRADEVRREEIVQMMIEVGFEPDSVVCAVDACDSKLLVHSGFISAAT